MPKWGLSMKEGSILKWIKSNGDNISKGDMILEIETEKVVNEMESPENGKILKICVNEGDTVPVGSIIAVCGKQDASNEEIVGFNRAIAIVADKLGISEQSGGNGYRLIANAGKDSHQEVPHLHFHLLAGRPLGPMVLAEKIKLK